MKEIHLECAGAGKTYSIAERAMQLYEVCPQNKKIYIITYTHYAIAQIKKEIMKRKQEVPSEIVFDTIHGFLLEQIIYPFSKFIKGTVISTCSIEKLSDIISFKTSRIKKLKDENVIHSDEVTKYARSLIVELSNDKVKDKERKKIAIDYITSDIFGLFVDEAQDMDQQFFDLILQIIYRIENYYFVGDPSQAIKFNDCYQKFSVLMQNRFSINTKYNFVSRRLPQCIVPICNGILRNENQITSTNTLRGEVAYTPLSELADIELQSLASQIKFTYIKCKEGVFCTSNDKPCIPAGIGKKITEKYPNCDSDAIIHLAKKGITNSSVSEFLRTIDLVLDKKSYAILASQFDMKKVTGEIHVDSIQKVKGLEDSTAYFIICNSLLEILFGLKNNYDKETNLLYVALTRTKERLLFVVDDCSCQSKGLLKDKFKLEKAFNQINIQKAKKSDWF